MDILYTATVTAVGGRDSGLILSSDHRLEAKLSTPSEMGGPGDDGTNPEQLFAAAYASCFLNAIRLVAKATREELPTATSVTAHVSLGRHPHKQKYGLDIELHVSIPGFELALAQALAHSAHELCPYSSATRDNVPVRLVVD